MEHSRSFRLGVPRFIWPDTPWCVCGREGLAASAALPSAGCHVHVCYTVMVSFVGWYAGPQTPASSCAGARSYSGQTVVRVSTDRRAPCESRGLGRVPGFPRWVFSSVFCVCRVVFLGGNFVFLYCRVHTVMANVVTNSGGIGMGLRGLSIFMVMLWVPHPRFVWASYPWLRGAPSPVAKVASCRSPNVR